MNMKCRRPHGVRFLVRPWHSPGELQACGNRGRMKKYHSEQTAAGWLEERRTRPAACNLQVSMDIAGISAGHNSSSDSGRLRLGPGHSRFQLQSCKSAECAG